MDGLLCSLIGEANRASLQGLDLTISRELSMKPLSRLGLSAALLASAFALVTTPAVASVHAPPGGSVVPGPAWKEPRYKIEAVSFTAVDETGYTDLGSDEVMVRTVDITGWSVSDAFDGVDTGETRTFNPRTSCIVGVQPGVATLNRDSLCSTAGEPATRLGFKVTLWEKDPVGWGSYGASFCVPHQGLRHSGRHCADNGDGDDFIGWKPLSFTTQDVESVLPRVGDVFTESTELSPCEENTVCSGRDSTYRFTYRITRLADAAIADRGGRFAPV